MNFIRRRIFNKNILILYIFTEYSASDKIHFVITILLKILCVTKSILLSHLFLHHFFVKHILQNL